MKYTNETPLGLTWAGLIEVQTAYNWDPATLLSGVPASAVLGVEAPLWTETITKLADIEFMAFPRLPALAELAWSPQSARNWDTFKVRLGAQGPRWTVQGINYYRSPQVPWGTAPSNSPTPPTGNCGTATPWNATTAYVGNSFVSYNGHKWRSKWWTQGEVPGNNSSGVWEDQGLCGTPVPSQPPSWSPSPPARRSRR
jgi:hexosaminidase